MKRTWRYIVVRSKASPERITKKQRVAEFALSRGWTRVGEAEWTELRRALPAISITTVRVGLKQTELPVDQPFRGVEQHTFEELADSLSQLSAVYATGTEPLRRTIRTEVIAAKDRARFASLNEKADPQKRAIKAEMVEWGLLSVPIKRPDPRCKAHQPGLDGRKRHPIGPVERQQLVEPRWSLHRGTSPVQR